MHKSLVRSHDHYRVYSNGDIEFTEAGIHYYQPYFKKLGFDINAVTTISRMVIAARLIRPLTYEEIVKPMSTSPNNLESRCLEALEHGDDKEFARLSNILQLKHSHGLHIVK